MGKKKNQRTKEALVKESLAEVVEKTDSEKGSFSFFQTVLAFALILLVSWVAYSTSFEGAIVLDGNPEILSNPDVHTLANPWKTMFEGNRLPARPIPYLTFAINYSIHGADVWGYHFVNLMIHIACAWLIYQIMFRTILLPSLRERYSKKAAYWASLAVALVWCAHPLQTQGVMYIYQRIETLMAFFYLATLYCFIRSRTSSDHFLFWGVLCVICCYLGMLSKEVMFTAPLALLWYERVFLVTSWREFKSRRSLLYLPLFASWIILYLLVQSQSEQWHTIFLDETPSSWHYLMTQAEVIPYYIRLFFVPYPLCFEYRWPIQESLSNIILPGLLMLLLLAGTVWAMAKRPKMGFLAGCFFLILGPTSSFKPIFQPAVEHRLYLPAVAFIALIVFLVLEGVEILKRKLPARKAAWLSDVLAGFLVIVVLTFTLMSRERNTVYHSGISLWSDTIEKRPNNDFAYFQLGAEYEAKGEDSKAYRYYKKTVELAPDGLGPLKALGFLELKHKRYDDAEKHFLHGIEVVPGDYVCYAALGDLYYVRGDFNKAIQFYEQAIELKPGHIDYLSNYAWALSKDATRQAEAEAVFQKVIVMAPNQFANYFNYALYLTKQKRLKAALEQTEKALRLNPGFARARKLRAHLLNALPLQQKKDQP